MLAAAFCCVKFLAPEIDPTPAGPSVVAYGQRALGPMQGMVLSCLVRKGMSPEEVQHILGRDFLTAADCGSSMDSYDRYAIQVYWSNMGGPYPPDRPMVVEEVRYVWEAWTELAGW